MGKLKRLVIHCTATREGRYFDQYDIKMWHLSPKPSGRGWSRPGYSELILLDGTIQTLQEYDDDDIVTSNELTNGAKGYNGTSRHICYVGGLDSDGNYKDTRTKEQIEAMVMYCRAFKALYYDCEIVGHYDLSDKKPFCPGFDVKQFLEDYEICV